MMQPLVSIVIVTWNGRELLRRFLPSVLAQDGPREIILVDNASTDGTPEFVRDNFPEVQLIRNARNDGTAEGSNVGARVAHGDLLFFLSNDMELEPGVVRRLSSHFAADPMVGVCTLKMRRITAEGHRLDLLDSVGGDVDVFGMPHARGIHETDHGQWDTPQEVFFSFGGALMIRRTLFEQIGGYDAAYFTLADDIDLCWRVRLLGYRVLVEPAAVLYHRVSATLDTPAFPRSFRRFLSERNTLRTLLKNYSMLALLWVLPLDLFLVVCESLFFLLCGHVRLACASPRAVAWNIRHIGETLAERRRIQSMRKAGDDEILRHMLKGSQKLRMLWHYFRVRAGGQKSEWDGYFGAERRR